VSRRKTAESRHVKLAFAIALTIAIIPFTIYAAASLGTIALIDLAAWLLGVTLTYDWSKEHAGGRQLALEVIERIVDGGQP
jgi:hypothetical protein